jgi:hypothetical protein
MSQDGVLCEHAIVSVSYEMTVDQGPVLAILPHLDKVMCHAPVVKLVDALDSKSSSERNAGSSPARGTKSTIFNHSTPACQAVEAVTHDAGYLLCALVQIQLAGRLAGGAV